MTCPKCGGYQIKVLVCDPSNPFTAIQCLNCGWLVERLMDKNRNTPRSELPGARTSGKLKNLTKEKLNKLIKSGLSQNKIAKMYDVSQPSIAYRKKSFGL